MSTRKRKTKNTRKKTETQAASQADDPVKEKGGEVKSEETIPDAAQERDEFKERLQRTTAEFSNYQKRMQREIEEIRKYAAAPLALELLGAVDNFHRAIQSASGNVDDDFLKGFQMIEDQLKEILEKQGVVPIEAHLQAFDPNFHEALLEEEEDSIPDKTVLEELEKGYMLHDRLLRPTRVKVSRKSVKEKAEADPDANDRDEPKDKS